MLWYTILPDLYAIIYISGDNNTGYHNSHYQIQSHLKKNIRILSVIYHICTFQTFDNRHFIILPFWISDIPLSGNISLSPIFRYWLIFKYHLQIFKYTYSIFKYHLIDKYILNFEWEICMDLKHKKELQVPFHSLVHYAALPGSLITDHKAGYLSPDGEFLPCGIYNHVHIL